MASQLFFSIILSVLIPAAASAGKMMPVSLFQDATEKYNSALARIPFSGFRKICEDNIEVDIGQNNVCSFCCRNCFSFQ
jgi:hypothetical protein